MGLGAGNGSSKKDGKAEPATGSKGGKGKGGKSAPKDDEKPAKGTKAPAEKGSKGSASAEKSTKSSSKGSADNGGKAEKVSKGGDKGSKSPKGDKSPELDQAGGHKDAFKTNDDGSLTKACNAGEWKFYKDLKNHKKLMPFCPKLIKVEGKADADPKVTLENLTFGYEKPCVMDIKMGVTSAAPDADDAKRANMEANDKSTTTVSLGVRVVAINVYKPKTKEWVKHSKPWGKALTDDTFADGVLEFFDTGSDRDWRTEVVKPLAEEVAKLQVYMRKQSELWFISSSLLFVYDAVGEPKPQVKMIDFAHVFPLEDGKLDEGYLKGLSNLLPLLEGLAAGNKIGGKAEASASDDEDAAAAREGLAALQLTDDQIKKEWDTADKDGSGSLTKKEIVRLLGKMNIKKSDKYVKDTFAAVDVDNSGELDFEEFKLFLERVRMRQEILDIFHTAAGGKDHMTAKEFAKWVSTNQKEKLDNPKEVVKQFEPSSKGDSLYVTGFSAYLQSPMCSGLSLEHRKVSQDMTQPMAHYWLASSHNTYLLGDQLKGESSVQAYINAFEKSCRCVELDCWDDPKDLSKPIIYHGHTLTSKITFEDVIKTIRDYGFKKTQYPIILSLEVHCGEEGQQAMAKIMKSILGKADMLPEQFEKTGRCPPPGELLNKVLLKGKMGIWDDEEDEDPEDRAEAEAAIAAAEAAEKKGKKGKKNAADADADGEKKDTKKKKSGAVAKELSDMVHLKAVHWKSWSDSKENGKAWEMSSFAETKVLKIVDTEPVEFTDYNTRQLSRIYPKGMRIDSSNYDPTPSWNCGSQIVALNYQTGAEETWLNDGKFLGNGNCGYVLKPDFMRGTSSKFDYRVAGPVKKTLVIRVVSGWQFPKGTSEKDKGEIIDPYISIAVHGVKADKTKKSWRTKTINNNGFNPVWEHLSTDKAKKPAKPKNVAEFPLTEPELALVLFKVYDEDFATANDFIAQYCASATHLGEGYHSLPLKNPMGIPYKKSSLLVHISWK